jgi:hypothetical protein
VVGSDDGSNGEDDEPPGDPADDGTGRPVTLPQPCGAIGIVTLGFALLALGGVRLLGGPRAAGEPQCLRLSVDR